MPKFRMPTLMMTTDIVIFKIRDDRHEILLIPRGNPPYQGKWALPGGLVEEDEHLDVCAYRELEKESDWHVDSEVRRVRETAFYDRTPRLRRWCASNRRGGRSDRKNKRAPRKPARAEGLGVAAESPRRTNHDGSVPRQDGAPCSASGRRVLCRPIRWTGGDTECQCSSVWRRLPSEGRRVLIYDFADCRRTRPRPLIDVVVGLSARTPALLCLHPSSIPHIIFFAKSRIPFREFSEHAGT